MNPQELTEYVLAKAITKTTTMRILMKLETMEALLVQERPEPKGLSPDRFPRSGAIYIEANRPDLTLREINAASLQNQDNEGAAGAGLANPAQVEAAQPLVNLQTGEKMPEEPRFQGIFIAGAGDTRICMVCYSSPDQIMTPTFEIHLPTGAARSMNKDAAATPINADQMMNFLDHLTNPRVEIVPEPLNRQQKRRLQREGIENPWNVIKPTNRRPDC